MFGQDAFKYSTVVTPHKEKERNVNVDQLLEACDGRYYDMFTSDRGLLMQKTENVVRDSRETFLETWFCVGGEEQGRRQQPRPF